MTNGKWKNKKNTSEKTSVLGSWKNYWELKTNNKFNACCVRGCTKKAEVGGHICQGDATEYIAPICTTCNNNTSEFCINTGTEIVRVSDDKIFTV